MHLFLRFHSIEGRDAFQRLQEALIIEYGDQSMLSAWSGKSKGHILAESPSHYWNCFDVIKWRPSWSKLFLSPLFQIGQWSITTCSLLWILVHFPSQRGGYPLLDFPPFCVCNVLVARTMARFWKDISQVSMFFRYLQL